MPEVVFEIRQFSAALDYYEISGWWRSARLESPPLKRIPQNTFIVDADGVPVVTAGMILTDIDVVWIDNFVGNPLVRGELRREATKFLLEHMESLGSKSGYQLFFCMALCEKLKYYYEQLGFKMTCQNVFTFTKEI